MTKYSDDFIQGAKRMIKDKNSTYTIKKGAKTKANF